MLDAIPLGIDIVDKDLNIIYLNETMARKVGRNAVGEKCYRVYRDDQTRCSCCPLRNRLHASEGNVVVTEKVMGGRCYKITHRAIHFRGQEAILEVFEDITDIRRAESCLKQSFEKLQRALEGTVSALAATVETRDPYTAGHQQRVARLAHAVGKEMGFSFCQVNGIRVAGILHDLGKIYVPAEILSKPGRLTEAEFNLIKTHPQVGYEILKNIEFEWSVAEIVLQHHERMDGTGYPLGLAGEQILMEARIIAVADVVETIHSHRPYRPAVGIEKALEEIERNRVTKYDPDVVDACLRLFQKEGFVFS
ncbi:MAG: HD domain-containing protein [Alphaproteobacteria bacterium]|uniref:HD domain-containing protein n=1 Tax=Candidatus Nitrobium versatile TaxID=2884831 RepID=A0A953SCS5_9BACT|nr:HD domain-containing protein [Candidatus Nitrobium versatile]